MEARQLKPKAETEWTVFWFYIANSNRPPLQAARVSAHHFWDPKLSSEWKRAEDLHAEGKPYGTNEIADVEVLTGLTDRWNWLSVGAATAAHYEMQMVDCWRARFLAVDLEKISNEIAHGSETVEGAISRARASLAEAEAGGAVASRTAADVFEKQWKRMSENTKAGLVDTLPMPPTLQLGFGGWKRGKMYIGIAPTSHHKTTFGRWAWQTVAKSGVRATYWIMEDSAEDITARTAAEALSFMTTREFMIGNFGKQLDMIAHGEAVDLMQQPWMKDAAIIDRRRNTVSDVEGIIGQEAGRGTQFVVVDFLQMIRKSDGRQSQTEHIDELSQRLQDLAASLNIAILVLAQITQESTKGMAEGKPPNLGNLRGGAGAVQAAYGVIVLWVDGKLLNVHTAKFKAGARKKFQFELDPAHDRIIDAEGE